MPVVIVSAVWPGCPSTHKRKEWPIRLRIRYKKFEIDLSFNLDQIRRSIGFPKEGSSGGLLRQSPSPTPPCRTTILTPKLIIPNHTEFDLT